MRWLKNLGMWGLLPTAVLSFNLSAQAAPVDINISIENTSPFSTFSIPAFAGLFHDGSHDYFDVGSNFPLPLSEASEGSCFFSTLGDCALLNAVASTGDFFGITAAEALFNDPKGTAVTGLSTLLTPGAITMATVVSDDRMQFFSFFAEILPTNDSFIGSDVAIDISSLFNQTLGQPTFTITLHLSDIINLGIEGDGTFGGAFQFGDFPQDGDSEFAPISAGTTDFSVFDGAFVDAGIFDFSALASNPEILSITLSLPNASVTPAPEPGPIGILGLGLLGVTLARRKKGAR